MDWQVYRGTPPQEGIPAAGGGVGGAGGVVLGMLWWCVCLCVVQE